MTDTVVIQNVLSEGTYGGAIFNAMSLSGKTRRYVAARDVMPRAPLPGEVWTISGSDTNHPKYGEQVVASNAILQTPSGSLITATIAKSKKFPGIGEKKATLLWEEFGENIYKMLDSGDPLPFVEVIGDELADVLLEGWSELAVEADVYKFLDQHGIPVWLASKLIIIYGNDTVKKLKENPYRLLAFTSWKLADRVARNIGVPDDDERRLIAAAEAVSYDRLKFAHTTTDKDEFHGRVMARLGADEKTADQAIKLAIDDHAILKLNGGYQGIGPASMEQFIAERTRDMVDGNFVAKQATLRGKISTSVDAILTDFELKEKITLNAEQREAVHMALESPVSVIMGGAGVGKTTVLKAIHSASERLGGHIYQMALAGRAAKRMTEATGRPSTTIMGFLKAVDAEKITLEDEPTLIIDEASMVDLPMMYRIMRRMEPGSRLVLVGDPAQLPPINFGLVFHALCETDDVLNTELITVHRQAASTGIPQVSLDVRNGRVPAFSNYAGKGVGVSFIDCAADDIVDTIMDLTNDLGGVHKTQIIGAVKNGVAGTVTINEAFHKLLSPSKLALHGFAEDEPVLWTVNDYDLGLMNGSLGVVKHAHDVLHVDFEGDLKAIDADAVRDMDYAYAITCHKAQGSQFSRVVIPVVGSRLLDRTLLYTAITRAQKQVILVGDRKAFEGAVVAKPNPENREVGLHFYLEGSKGCKPK